MIGAGVAISENFAAGIRDQIGQTEIEHFVTSRDQLLDGGRRFLESRERVQDIMRIYALD